MRKTYSVSSIPGANETTCRTRTPTAPTSHHTRAQSDDPTFHLPEDSEFSMPLLVRKLSVFRKGLVQERNLRTQAESSVERLKEKLKIVMSQYEEVTKQAQELSVHSVLLEKQVATTKEEKSNEKKLDSIFSSFGSKNIFERDNIKLKEKIESLRRQRNNAGARIEELEKQLDEMHKAGLTHSELFASVDREMIARENALDKIKIEKTNIKNELRIHYEKHDNAKLKWEKERTELLLQINELERNRDRQEEHGGITNSNNNGNGNGDGDTRSENEHRDGRNNDNGKLNTYQGERKDDNNNNNNNNNNTVSEISNPTNEKKEINALQMCLEQQLQKMSIVKERANTLERFWVEASQYDAFVVKFQLYKLRKVLGRRAATIVIRRPIHQRDRNGNEELGGVSMIVTRSGETFVHPAETIVEVALLSREKQARGVSLDERAFRVKYTDSKTDWFEGKCYVEVMEMLRLVLGLKHEDEEDGV